MINLDNPQLMVAEAEAAGEALAQVRAEIGKAVFGQERVIELRAHVRNQRCCKRCRSTM